MYTHKKQTKFNRIAALSRIQKLLKESGKIQLAVAFLRASREVWPEGEVFGAPDIRPEGELLLLRELFYADLPGETHTHSPLPISILKKERTM